jgi:hypothetical protein
MDGRYMNQLGLIVLFGSCSNLAQSFSEPVPTENPAEPPLIGTASSPVPGQIDFELNEHGNVSLAIFDSTGQMIRTLLNAQSFPAGNNSVMWDGKDDTNNLPTNGPFTYKFLQTRGLRAEYLMTLQTTLPIGQSWTDREVGMGNHDGATAVAIDGNAAYLASGVSETTLNALKMTLDGSARIWSAHQPDISMGRYSIATMDGQLYSLQQDGWVSYQGVDQPNTGWSAVGATPATAGNGDYVGVRWDAQLPGTIRGDANAWAGPEQPMDLAAFNDGISPQLVVSYRDQNAVIWRDPATGVVAGLVNVIAPKGVAIDNQGNVLIASEDKIIRVSRANHQLDILAAGLTFPFRLDVDRTNGQIVVAESGTSQQVKVLAPTGEVIGIQTNWSDFLSAV